MTNGDDRAAAQAYWDEHYRERESAEVGEPNAHLVEQVGGVAPGTALDLGCGEGDDAIWLARQGWRVTAVDVSATALQRAERFAASAGVGDRIVWQRHDLASSFPAGSYDLVSTQFLHSPVDFPRERVLRAAAAAAAPGGLLLVVGHATLAPWAPPRAADLALPTPQEVLESLRLAPDRWHVERLDSPSRRVNGPDGRSATVIDSVLAVRRLPR